MNAKFPLATTAALIADPARSAILLTLLDGRALAAGELACAANVSAQSASMHLAQLLQGGFIELRREGRHRYYRIGSAEIAHAIEALGCISSPRRHKPIGESESIRYARTCYDHLAGVLGVNLAAAFERSKYIVARDAREYRLTPKGEAFFSAWSIDVMALRKTRRSFAKRCLDWTERRDHIAGALGAAICQKMLDSRWIKRDRDSRVVHLTSSGREKLAEFLPSTLLSNS
jgi:DNA-binding transcriptional ArsR family regulator